MSEQSRRRVRSGWSLILPPCSRRRYAPLFVACGTGFCGSLTTFSSWMHDVFAGFANVDEPTLGRFNGVSFERPFYLLGAELPSSTVLDWCGHHYRHSRSLPSIPYRRRPSLLPPPSDSSPASPSTEPNPSRPHHPRPTLLAGSHLSPRFRSSHLASPRYLRHCPRSPWHPPSIPVITPAQPSLSLPPARHSGRQHPRCPHLCHHRSTAAYIGRVQYGLRGTTRRAGWLLWELEHGQHFRRGAEGAGEEGQLPVLWCELAVGPGADDADLGELVMGCGPRRSVLGVA